jgi:hypothetical protein
MNYETTKRSPKEVVNNIHKEIENARGTHIWDDYVNALRLISQVVFTRSSGFVLELLQNAEDAGIDVPEKGCFQIRINQYRVKIAHNGGPFKENDVKAISGIRSSKKPEKGFLGYLGIGFKSVLKVSDCPEIYSNGYQFKFDRTYWQNPSATPWHVIPIWIDSPSEEIDPAKTTFIIPFRDASIVPKVIDEIKKLRLELYLFLRWLRKIEIIDEMSGEHYTLENLGENSEGITTLKSDSEERRFKFFHRQITVPEPVKHDRLTQEYRANVTQREIAIGFALDKDGNLAPDEAGAMYGGVYSFLPLGEAKSGAKFPIQADFLVQPGRDSLNYEAQWNHWLLDQVKGLCIEAIEYFKNHNIWQYQFLPAFEFTKSKGLESYEKLFFPRLIEPIEKYLNENECVITIDGSWAKFSDVVRLCEKEKAIQNLSTLQLFSKDAIASVFGGKPNLMLVHPEVRDKNSQPIRKVDRWTLLENIESLQSKVKDAAWFLRLYQWLQDNPVYEEYYPSRARNPRYRTLGYHKYEFVLTAQNELKKGGEVYLTEISSTDSTIKELAHILQISRPILHSEILSALSDKENQSLKGFLTGFTGVQILNVKTICQEAILPKITTKTTAPEPDELINLTRLSREIIGSELGPSAELWIVTKAGDVKPAKEVLFSREFKPIRDWETKSQYVPGLNFISPTYLSTNPDDEELTVWREFFKAGGIKENPDNGVEQLAINYALDKLCQKFGNVQLVDKLNYGYDIQATTVAGSPVQIEVKGVSSEQNVELTGNEANAADTYKETFYLCVVASIPNSPVIYLVNNPAKPGIGKKDKLTIPSEIWKTFETI